MPRAISTGVTGIRGGGIGGGVRVLGIDTAIAELRGVDAAVRLKLGLLMYQAAKDTEAAAKGNIHNVTGNLSEGTQAQKLGPYTWNVSSSSLDGGVSEKNDKEYAPYVEFGTSRMEPRFYLSTALDTVLPLVQAELVAMAAEIERF